MVIEQGMHILGVAYMQWLLRWLIFFRMHIFWEKNLGLYFWITHKTCNTASTVEDRSLRGTYSCIEATLLLPEVTSIEEKQFDDLI